MKLAVISDIHGDAQALDRVLAAIDDEGIGADRLPRRCALSGYEPRRSIHLLIARSIPTLKGNTDARILERDPYQPDDPVAAAHERDWLDWTVDQLGNDELAFLESLPATIELDFGGVSVTCSHGSPRSYYDPVLPHTGDAALTEWFASTDAEVLLVGHTHQQILRRWNARTIVNPGPVTRTFSRLDVNGLPPAPMPNTR
ncbi:MAG: metallophosphoesterase family protein [Thermomicrobiales bacterium]